VVALSVLWLVLPTNDVLFRCAIGAFVLEVIGLIVLVTTVVWMLRHAILKSPY
jgi:hypothetical protein